MLTALPLHPQTPFDGRAEAKSGRSMIDTTHKRAAFFVAPRCNQLAAAVMHGLKVLGYSLFANRAWCCGLANPNHGQAAAIPEWNWCELMSDEDLLKLSEEPDVLVVGTVRYETASYWGQAYSSAAQIAEDIQTRAVRRGLVTLFIDDSDYHTTYPQLSSVPYYFKRELGEGRTVHPLSLCLCPWLTPILPTVDSRRPLFFSACFPLVSRRTWDRCDTLRRLASSFTSDTSIWLGPVKEPIWTKQYEATGKRQGDKYLATLANSISSLSLPGEGWDTFRFWEILACGSCLISPRVVLSNLSIDPPPVDGIHYVGFDTDDELIDLLINFRRDRDKAVAIAINGQRWALRYHTGQNRAASILNVISGSAKEEPAPLCGST